MYCLEEELLDLAVQHQQHGQGGNVLDADPEPAVGSEFLPLTGGLGVDYLGPELPAVHNAHQQRAQRHQNALGDAVKEVQPVGAPGGHLVGGIHT